MSDIIREVDEELRREDWEKVWDKYGRFIIGAAVAIVLTTAGVVGWREFDRSQRMQAGDSFGSVLAQVENTEDAARAAQLMAEYRADAPGSYETLARLREAKLRADAGAAEAAIALYDGLAADSGVEPLFRDLALLYSIRMQVDGGDASALRARLAPLLAEDNPWRYTAREIEAAILLTAGDEAGARETYTRLADDLQAPEGLRARAAEMLRALAP